MLPFHSATQPTAEQVGRPAHWFLLAKHKLLVQPTAEGGYTIPVWTEAAESGLPLLRSHFLGTLEGRPCYAAEVTADTPLPTGHEWQGLRPLLGQMAEPLVQVAGRALQIVDWDRNHQFCGRCATPLEPAADRAKVCPQCGLRSYPRISPAVIMAVRREDTLLLAHAKRHPAGFFSVLAGFAEPGETLEETVAREVAEEVGLAVRNIRYFGSQPWPFPDSLMIGFTCEYAGGEIQFNDDEIGEAGWYTAAQIPHLLTPPARISIAGALIADFTRGGMA